MDEFLKAVFIVIAMFGFFLWERRYQRIGDLRKTLEIIQGELRRDAYDISIHAEGDITTLQLSNDISRITHREGGAGEVLECNLFFMRKEDRGANKTVLSRNMRNKKTIARISYLRRNELLGRVLYRHSGITRNAKVHLLMNEIIGEIKKCQLRANPISHTIN